MICTGGEYPIESYSSYKGRMFNKKLEKLRSLLNSIDSLSLKSEDKQKLLFQLKNMINEKS